MSKDDPLYKTISIVWGQKLVGWLNAHHRTCKLIDVVVLHLLRKPKRDFRYSYQGDLNPFSGVKIPTYEKYGYEAESWFVVSKKFLKLFSIFLLVVVFIKLNEYHFWFFRSFYIYKILGKDL